MVRAVSAHIEIERLLKRKALTLVMSRRLVLHLQRLAPAAVTASLALVLGWRVQAGHLDLAAGLLLLATLGGATVTVIHLVARPAVTSERGRARLWSLVISIAFSLVALELGLRLVARDPTYPSNLRRALWAPYSSGNRGAPTWFHTYHPGITFEHPRTEFAFPRYTNSIGLCEREIPRVKATDEFRLVALGDSFTEGLGAPAEGTWPRALEVLLNGRRASPRVTVFNAGVVGSDPWYEYVLLRDKLIDVEADLVLVAVNRTDITDVITRGGEERFRPDGTTLYARQPPWWEWIYGISYIARRFVHDVLRYDYRFLQPAELGPASSLAADQVFAAIRAFERLAADRGFTLVTVVHPTRRDARRGRYDGAMASLAGRVTHDQSLLVVDVLAAWQESDVLIEHDVSSLYWPLDGHLNPSGYALFADAVATAILRLGLIPAPIPSPDHTVVPGPWRRR